MAPVEDVSHGRALEIGPRHSWVGRTDVRLLTVTTKGASGELSGALEDHGRSAIVTSVFAGDLCS